MVGFDLNRIVKDEYNALSTDLYREILEEGILSDLKTSAKKVMDKIKNFVTKLYNNIFKKVIDNLKKYIDKGIEYFLDALGIQIEGTVQGNVTF